VYELPRETLGDKVIRWARAAVKKSREQRQ
jgi:hypothetical protein